MLSIERVDRKREPRLIRALPLDHVVLRVAPQAVLGPKDRFEIQHTLLVSCPEMLQRVAIPAVYRGLVADHSDALSL